jgi:hypothetical protein
MIFDCSAGRPLQLIAYDEDEKLFKTNEDALLVRAVFSSLGNLEV